MTPTQHQEEALFRAATHLVAGPVRDAFLGLACAGDAELRRRVEALIAAQEEQQSLPGHEATSQASTVVMESAPEEGPGAVIGRYKLLEKIGEGGCGVVYQAEQSEPVKRRVALKVIKLGMDTRQVVARFEAERQALALMDHPNIAKVLDGGTTQAGRPFFVMELVKGIPITHYCDDRRLDTTQRLELFILVCQAIQHAHQKGIIHRDIKPSNILVADHEGEPVPKVIDFGIAKATAGQTLTDKTVFTALEQFIGTPAYMSPEQAEMSGLDIDTRSDIYSLGVLLYELLTGKTPFDAKRLVQAGLEGICRIIRQEEPPRPSTRLSTLEAAEQTTLARQRQIEPIKWVHRIRGDLDWMVMKCLEKDRNRRYETANGLAMDLKRHLNNEPVIARPPSLAYKFRKAWQRNKLPFTAGAAVVVVLVVGIGVSTWQAIVATRARTEAIRSHNAEKQERLRADAEKVAARRYLYVANMHLAQQAWEQSDISQLQQLLEETQASPDRGFEWYYWQRQSHLALRTLRGHLSHVTSAKFSPDGRWVATGSEDQTAKIWETTSGRELVTLQGHGGWVSSVAFSPDGQRIVTGSADRTAKVWEVASGRELLTLKGHTAPIWSVAFSPDGQRILTGSWDQAAKVWEAASGRELVTLKKHKDEIWAVTFSPDGQRIVTGSKDKTAKVWEAATGRELLTLNGHNATIRSAAFSPDGQRIVTGSDDGTAKVWEATTGRELLTLKGAHGNLGISVAFSPDAKRIVTTSDDRAAKVWESETGRALFTLKGHSAQIWSVAFSPDGQRIVTASWDQTAKVWAAAVERELLTLKGHTAGICSVAFSWDAQRAVTGSDDQTAQIWDTSNGQKLLTLKSHRSRITSASFSPDGQRIVTGSWDQTAKVWETAGGHELLTLKGHRGRITSVAFSPDGRQIVTGSDDQTAKVWEVANGQELLTLRGHNAGIWSVAFSPDGRRILTGSGDQTAKVWESAGGRELLTLKGHSARIRSVTFSPDGQRLATGSDDQNAKVWEVANGQELLTLRGHSDGITSVAFSPDGRRIVTGSDDQTAKVWEAANGRELLTLRGHSAGIRSVAFSPDGKRIMTGSEDQSAKVWQAAKAEEVLAWQEEEQAAEQTLAAVRRQRAAEEEYHRIARARDEGAIKRWLILAPLPLATNQSSLQAMGIEQIQGEDGLRPKAGDTYSIGNGELKWQEVVQEDYVIDFNAILGRETDYSVAYAVCYLWSKGELSGLRMLVGSNDESKIYLNGRKVYMRSFPSPFIADEDTVPDIALNAGLNVLIFKVVNEVRDWKGAIRFTDAQGNPVKDIKVRLDPEAKD